MCRLNFNFYLIAVALITSQLVSAKDDGKTNFNGDEEMLPLEQTIDSQDDSMVENKESAAQTEARESFTSNFNSNMKANTEFSLPHGAMQDAQESSASNKVVLVLNNDKNKFGEFVKPSEESFKRLIRNPDAIDDIIGQFQQLGGDMTQQLMQQVSQTAPDISKSFGQALNEVLTQTNLLASPVNLNLQNLSESGGFDLGQLGQNFLVGATQNLFNPNKDGTESDTAGAALMPGILGAAASNAKAESSSDRNEESSKATKNPFENLVGQSLLPQFPQLPQFGQLNPFGMFAHFSALAPPLMPAGSDISEVRVLPEQYAPYKLTPKQVDHQTMAEMKLKAVLKEALTKKTIPILWFHMPTNHKVSKTSEDIEMETKLHTFEQQVIKDLKQLQELAKMANDVKTAQLQSGAQPSESLTTKLNLFEIPVYDITVGDIEKTLKDEHVIMLMQTLVQQTQNKEFQRHQQATTKYLTDLTGTPIKRQVKTAEDTLNTMEKDDVMKMMAYAYRMASLNGHEMPWIKKNDMMMSNDKESAKSSMSDKKQKCTDADVQMNAERKWLADKQQQMAFEEAKQRKMFDDRQGKMIQGPMRHWADPTMMQQQQQQQQPQQQMPVQRPMIAPQMQHETSQLQTQMMPLQTQHPMQQQPMHMQNQLFGLEMRMQQQDMQRQMIPQPAIQQQIPMHRQQQQPTTMQMLWPQPASTQQFQRQSFGTNMAETMSTTEHKSKMPEQTSNFRMPQPMMTNVNMRPRTMPEMRNVFEQKSEQAQPKPTMPNMNTQEQKEQMPIQKEHQCPAMTPEMRSFTEHKPELKPHFRIPHSMMANANMQEQIPMMRSTTEQRPEQTQSTPQRNNFRMPQPMMTNTEMQKQMPMQIQHQQPLFMQMQGEQFQKQSTGTPEQKPEHQQSFEAKMPQQTTNFRMPQASMTNFNMQEQMAMQRQQQHPIMMPEMRSTTEQRETTESKRPEQTTTGFGAEKPPLTESMKAFEKVEHMPEQMQKIDTKTPQNTANMNTMHMDNTPTPNEPNPQMPDNEGKARFKGLEKLFDKLDLFGHHQHHGWHSGKQPVIHNYYYNAGGGHYKPAHGSPAIMSPSVPHHPPPHYHHPAPSYYGGGAHGSNAYGSPYGPYRAAVGEEEIAIMLQQQQQHQPMPKMIMLTPNNEDTTLSTEMKNYQSTAEEDLTTKNHPNKRLAMKRTQRLKRSPAAYVIVLRNNNYNSNTGRSRRKRSAEYATLEPIDENSLSALRKVYKNSLKEITLNPNETPAEALMRYNAESIREALEKANKQPLEIAAGEEDVEMKEENNSTSEGEQQQQQTFKQVTQGYALNDSGQLVPVTTETETPVNNGPYVMLPVGMPQTQQLPIQSTFNHPQTVAYDTTANQENLYNNMIPKYNIPGVYSGSNKLLTQNPYLSIYNPLESSPYADEYSVLNQPYQLGAEKAGKTLVYNDFSQSPNAINQNLQDYDKTKMLHYDNFVRDNGLMETYSSIRQPSLELATSYRSGRSQESSSIEHIMAAIKEQVVHCCDKCKSNILKGLDDTLRHKLQVLEEPYTLSYRKPSQHVEDLGYKQWLEEMSEKGYDKGQLTQQHQRDYLKDGKLNLHVENEQDVAYEVEKIYLNNNQSYKRETIMPVAEVEMDKETELVTAPIENKFNSENLAGNEAEDEKEDEMQLEENKAEPEAKKQTSNEAKSKITTAKEDKNNAIDKKATSGNEKPQNLNVNKTVETAETTTHNVYALRGQFRSYRPQPRAFSLKQAKQFSNFKSVDKLGTSNSIAKTNHKETVENKSDKLEKILDILHDLQKHNQESGGERQVDTTISTSTTLATSTTNSLTASPLNGISKISISANNAEKPKKQIRRKSKSRKLV